MSKKKTTDERLITIQASYQEWKAVEKIITAYRRQCKFQNHHDATLGYLESFQKRLTQQTQDPLPDDYMI